MLFDYLEILRAALAARGLDYKVAGKVQNVDVELPMVTGSDPLTFDDIRLTDFDVVLARSDVSVSKVVALNYQARLFLSNLGLEVPRGYVALDATVGSRTYRFATTHLEDTPFPDIQLAQARELAAALSPETKPVVLVGDFNSPAPDGGAYPYLVSQGFVDAWPLNRRTDQGQGLTWGHDPDLRNPNDAFTVRIDLVFVRGGFSDSHDVAVTADVWGDEPSERTASGMWASDHAAVIAQLTLPEPPSVAAPPATTSTSSTSTSGTSSHDGGWGLGWLWPLFFLFFFWL
jgi:endonuclease/exonuclease/phosphatase family metal-dependent hydrolase